ncbi:MAG: trypsin-like peptidase domain-containing protein [Oscillospiraceae bacterium]|nr:trypsin-like peptidase domain-containing protein [Oscillospiraceae bacterium]
MKKAIISILVVAVLLSQSITVSASGLGNFRNSEDFTTGRFRDVGETDWFAGYVESAYNHGLVRGRGEETFAPGGLLTLGEAVALAVRMRNVYKTGASDFPAGDGSFYAVYAEYALDNEIIIYGKNFSAPATRAQFAELIYNALPGEVFGGINEIAYFGIPDVVPGSSFAPAVYALFRAGIVAGSDRFGTFFPHSQITRAEAAAIMTRTITPGERVNASLPHQIPANAIFERSADAVIMIEMFNALGEPTRTGSGFFISGAGLAVTNLHVVELAENAIATLNNGKRFPVSGVKARCRENNLAIILIDTGDAVSYLSLADSDSVETGDQVFTIGSPEGLFNSITEGIISNTSREIGGNIYFQFTAAISFGSGGSPLLNGLGQVIGVASSSMAGGQSLNLAVPGNLIRELEPGAYYIPLSDLHRMP